MWLRPSAPRQPPRVARLWTKLVSSLPCTLIYIITNLYRHLCRSSPTNSYLNYKKRPITYIICFFTLNYSFFLLRRMPKAVWSVGGFWFLPITGIVVEGGLEFTAQYYLLALVVIAIPTLERGPWWRQVEFPFTPEIASLVFLSLSVQDARQGPSVGHTSSNAILSIFSRLSQKSGAWPHSLWQAAY